MLGAPNMESEQAAVRKLDGVGDNLVKIRADRSNLRSTVTKTQRKLQYLQRLIRRGRKAVDSGGLENR